MTHGFCVGVLFLSLGRVEGLSLGSPMDQDPWALGDLLLVFDSSAPPGRF